MPKSKDELISIELTHEFIALLKNKNFLVSFLERNDIAKKIKLDFKQLNYLSKSEIEGLNDLVNSLLLLDFVIFGANVVPSLSLSIISSEVKLSESIVWT